MEWLKDIKNDVIESDNNIVYTKPEMAKYLLSLIKFKKGDVVIEPCRGKGAFYDNFPKNVKKVYCELEEGKDYLKYNGMVDITVSNPPFIPRKLFWNFHKKAMETTRRGIYWLINMSALNVFTPKRLEEMNGLGWYIQRMHIVSDKRWFGRYVFIEITKNKNDIFSYNKKSF